MAMAGKAVTLADIAARANVAVKTASKVLSNDPTVRPYIRELVLKIATELGYSPNPLAQALRSKSLKLISFHVTELYNPFFGALFENIAVRLSKHGYMVIPCDGVDEVNETNQRMFACATILTSAGPDKIRRVKQDGPLISINASEPLLELASDVSIDFKWGYAETGRRLLAAGRTRLGYCAPEHEFKANESGKFRHLERALDEAGAHAPRRRAALEFHAAAEVVDWLRVNPGGLDAIVCSNDIVAVKVIDSLYRHGLGFPGDIKVVGCDGTLVVEDMWTLKVDISLLADMAVELLIKTLKDKKHRPEQHLLKPEPLTP